MMKYGWRLVGGSDNLQLVLRPLFIEDCAIFSWRLEVYLCNRKSPVFSYT
ncbi:hypothetical protein SAMN04487852_10769 [Prevotella sp. tf2-5]|nr:hypothetical protein SAMN04487852_10769 [Prevotella sp. tf2-5]